MGSNRCIWTNLARVGSIWARTGSTGRNGLESDPSPLARTAPAAAPDELAGDSGDGSARRRCQQLRLGEGKPLTPTSPAAVVGNAPTSSVCRRDGSGARRRKGLVGGRSQWVEEVHLVEAVVWPACGGPQVGDGGDRVRGAAADAGVRRRCSRGAGGGVRECGGAAGDGGRRACGGAWVRRSTGVRRCAGVGAAAGGGARV